MKTLALFALLTGFSAHASNFTACNGLRKVVLGDHGMKVLSDKMVGKVCFREYNSKTFDDSVTTGKYVFSLYDLQGRLTQTFIMGAAQDSDGRHASVMTYAKSAPDLQAANASDSKFIIVSMMNDSADMSDGTVGTIEFFGQEFTLIK